MLKKKQCAIKDEGGVHQPRGGDGMDLFEATGSAMKNKYPL